MPGLSDYLSQVSEAVVQGALVSYFFVQNLLKGQSDLKDDDHMLCLDNKPACCLHGSTTTPQKSSSQQKHDSAKPAPAQAQQANKPQTHAAFQQPAFTPAPSSAKAVFTPTISPPLASPAKEKAHNFPAAPPPPPPPPPAEPAAAPAWIEKAANKYASYEKMEKSPIIKATEVAASEPKAEIKDFLGDLKHEKVPRYPSAFESGSSDEPLYSSQAKMVFNPPAPPPPPTNTPRDSVGETTVQIQVKPPVQDGVAQRATIVTQKKFKSEARKSSLNRADDATTPMGVTDSPAILMKPEQPQVRAQAPRIMPAHQTETYTDQKLAESQSFEHAARSAVSQMRHQWPPPSNATGVEFYKDNWGAPVEVAPVYDRNPLMASWQQPENALFEPLPFSSGAEQEQSSFFSAADSESDYGLPKAVRNPQGDLQDYSRMSREYADPFTNMMSPEKSQELAKFLLEGEIGKGKGVQMFSRQRQRVEKYVHDMPRLENRPPETSSVQRNVHSSRWATAASNEPAFQPRYVSPEDVVESVHDAAARHDHLSQAQTPGFYNTDFAGSTPFVAPNTAHAHISTPIDQQLKLETLEQSRSAAERPSRLFSPELTTNFAEVRTSAPIPKHQTPAGLQPTYSTSAGPMPSVERLFSPTPFGKSQQRVFSPVNKLTEFNFSPAGSLYKSSSDSRTSQIGVSQPMRSPRDLTHRSSKQMTMSTLAITTPTTRIVTSSVSPTPANNSTYSTFNTFPRTWKSFSEAYKH